MSGERNSSGRLAPMALAALGVVFGDIGTSPLYAVSACFTGPGIAVTPEHVLGVLSLIFWSLVLVILLKYVSRGAQRRQQGRGRRAGADRAGDQHRARESAAKALRHLGYSGRLAVFRGWRHHARDFGVERRRRSACGGAGRAVSGAADHAGGIGRTVRHSDDMAPARSAGSSAR